VATRPESLAVGVSPGDTLVLVFSEKMDKGSVEDWLFLSPDVDRLELRWEGLSLRIRPRRRWEAGRTYVLLLGSRARDRRRNEMGQPFLLPFATAEALDRGEVEGIVRTGRLKPEGHFVFAWEGRPVRADSVWQPPGDLGEAIRRGETDDEGRFRLPFLPLGTPLTVAALYDADGNRAVDPERDLWGVWPEAVVLGDSVPRRTDLEIYLVYPDEPGSLAGEVSDSLCSGLPDTEPWWALRDSLSRLLRGEPAPPDTTVAAWEEWEAWAADTAARELTPEERRLLKARLDSLEARLAEVREESLYCTRPIVVELRAPGDTAVVDARRTAASFQFKDLPPGDYLLEAFRDLDGDGLRDPEDPWAALPETLRLEPARSLEELEIRLPVAPRPWPLEGSVRGDTTRWGEGP
jgi:hypothetical protein